MRAPFPMPARKGPWWNMEKKNNNRTTTNLILIVIALLLVTLNVVLIGGLLKDKDEAPAAVSGNAQTQQEPTEVVKVEDRIAIPGYEAIQLTADTLEQTICFPNPAQNCCYFQMSLYLEDGTLLWKSGDVAPGETSEPVVLSQPLAAGKYKDAILKYDCFTMDKKHSQLNGAQTKLMLLVQEG